MLNETTTLKSSFRGELIEQRDASYNTARKVYNGMIDRRPRLIARCGDVADVIAAVNFGRENNLVVSIRGGGHNFAGLGVCDDGLVIDLSRMNYVRVDPKKRTVLAGGGALLGDVDPCGAYIWSCGSSGNLIDDGCWRAYARRRDRPLDAPMRPYHRQSLVSRCGAGRRPLRYCERQR
jgi:FAD binding domain